MMNKIEKAALINISVYDSYEDYQKIEALRMHCDYNLLGKLNELIEWQNEMVDLMLNTSSVIHTLDGRLSQLEANTPQEPVDNKVDNKKTQVDDTNRTETADELDDMDKRIQYHLKPIYERLAKLSDRLSKLQEEEVFAKPFNKKGLERITGVKARADEMLEPHTSDTSFRGAVVETVNKFLDDCNLVEASWCEEHKDGLHAAVTIGEAHSIVDAIVKLAEEHYGKEQDNGKGGEE